MPPVELQSAGGILTLQQNGTQNRPLSHAAILLQLKYHWHAPPGIICAFPVFDRRHDLFFTGIRAPRDLISIRVGIFYPLIGGTVAFAQNVHCFRFLFRGEADHIFHGSGNLIPLQARIAVAGFHFVKRKFLGTATDELLFEAAFPETAPALIFPSEQMTVAFSSISSGKRPEEGQVE